MGSLSSSNLYIWLQVMYNCLRIAITVMHWKKPEGLGQARVTGRQTKVRGSRLAGELSRETDPETRSAFCPAAVHLTISGLRQTS
jgi:hypothetical protein